MTSIGHGGHGGALGTEGTEDTNITENRSGEPSVASVASVPSVSNALCPMPYSTEYGPWPSVRSITLSMICEFLRRDPVA